jgi:hypothetical protein
MKQPTELIEHYYCLYSIAYRIPQKNELYINKNNKIQRKDAVASLSKRAQSRVIVEERWDNPYA